MTEISKQPFNIVERNVAKCIIRKTKLAKEMRDWKLLFPHQLSFPLGMTFSLSPVFALEPPS